MAQKYLKESNCLTDPVDLSESYTVQCHAEVPDRAKHHENVVTLTNLLKGTKKSQEHRQHQPSLGSVLSPLFHTQISVQNNKPKNHSACYTKPTFLFFLSVVKETS